VKCRPALAAVLSAFVVGGCGSPGKMFLEAQKLDSSGNWAEAAGAYRKVADKYPKADESIKALFRAGEICEQKLADTRSAADVYRSLKELTEGKPESGEAMLRLGRALEAAGSPFKESLENYLDVKRKFAGKPEWVRATLATGKIYEMLHAWAQAGSTYEEALRTLPPSPEKDAAWGHLQSVWLLNALGLYFSGKMEDGVRIAAETLAQPLTVLEVRRGLEVFLRRNSLARRFWECHPARVQANEISLGNSVDPSRFIITAKAGEMGEAPPGWELKLDKKRKTFVVKQKKEESKAKEGDKKGGKKESAGKEGKKEWSFRSSADCEVTGCWWSVDGAYLGWAARERGGSKRVLEVLDLKTHRKYRVTSHPTGGAIGEILLFLPRSQKVVFPFRRYMVISDVRGGSQSLLKVRVPGPGPSFSGGDAKWLSCSADGLEVSAGIKSQAKKGKKGAEAKADELDIWKVNLTLMGDE